MPKQQLIVVYILVYYKGRRVLGSKSKSPTEGRWIQMSWYSQSQRGTADNQWETTNPLHIVYVTAFD